MGVGYQGLQMALLAKRRGIDFSRTVMLGRQNHYLDAQTLRSMFDRFGLSLRADEEQDILEDAYSERLFRKLGAVITDSIDASDYEGANILHDMNKPIGNALHKRYTCVIDFGTMEHVFNFPVALKNATDLLAEGGHFLSVTVANNFMGHGFYQVSPELFFSYLPANGFTDLEMYLIPFRVFPYLFRVSDPQQLRGRVELVNGEPVLMGVIACKARHVAEMVVPIQSDYYHHFWQGRDVDRQAGVSRALDPQTVAAIGELRQLAAQLLAWPEKLSPTLVQGFENGRHYELIDPAKV